MKPLFFFCLTLLVITTQTAAQYAPFPLPEMKYGQVYNCNIFDCPGYFNNSMHYLGDVEKGGKIWHDFNGPLIRAEAGRYYKLYNDTETLVYDFTKNLGDTLELDDLGQLKVIAVGTFILNNGELRKKMILRETGSPGFYTYVWVDGIGDIQRGFFRYKDFEGGYSEMICLRDSSGILYENPVTKYQLDCDSLLCFVPNPYFIYSCEGKTFEFLNQSFNAETYIWDFGDGESSTETNPTHTYTAPGCYMVTLNAKNSCLPQSYERYQVVTVDAPTWWGKPSNVPQKRLYKFQFVDAQRGWATSDSVFLKTEDGGLHWTPQPFVAPGNWPGDLDFYDFEHGISQRGKNGSPYYKDVLWTDDGQNWKLISLDDHLSVTALKRVSEESALVAGHYQGIFVTKDGGLSWTNVQPPGLVSLVEHFWHVGGDTVYLVGLNQFALHQKTVFCKTTDLIHWEAFPLPDSIYGNKLFFFDALRGWMVGQKLYQTTDGGVSWVENLDVFGLHDVAFADTLTGWTCGYGGLYRTTDGGAHWEQEACPRIGENIHNLAPLSPEKVYVNMKDGLYERLSVPDTVHRCGFSSAVQNLSEGQSAFRLYPNPATDQVTIEWEQQTAVKAVQFLLHSIEGKLMMEQEVTRDDRRVTLQNLKPGLYFVGLVADGRRLGGVEKLVVLR